MSLLRIIAFFLTICVMNYVYPQNKVLNICSDDNEEIPFLVIKDDETKGIYSDIILQAVTMVKEKSFYKIKVTPMPWNRCIEMLKQGQIDAVLNISYNNERAEFIQFPNDAGKNETNLVSQK